MPGVDSGFAGGELIDASDSEPFFVVAGSNDVPPLSVSVTSTPAPDQQVLIDAANNAELGVTGDANPFKNFPVTDLSNDLRDRNPFEVWKNNNE